MSTETRGEGENRSLESDAQVIENHRVLLLGQLVPSLVHNINNSLASLSGLAQLLAMTATDPAVRERATALNELVQKLSQSTEAIGKVGEGPQGTEESVSLRDLFAQVAEILSTKARHSNVVLSPALDDEALTVRGDAPLLRQLFLGLCLAAIDNVRAAGGGSVALRARREGHAARVEIVEEPAGQGAPAERAGDGGASGWAAELCFSACAAIARQHGGELERDGRCVIVRLPCAEC